MTKSFWAIQSVKYFAQHKSVCRVYLWRSWFVCEPLPNIVDTRSVRFPLVAMDRRASWPHAPANSVGRPNFAAYTVSMFSNAIRFDRISNKIPPNVYRNVVADYCCRCLWLFHCRWNCCVAAIVRPFSMSSMQKNKLISISIRFHLIAFSRLDCSLTASDSRNGPIKLFTFDILSSFSVCCAWAPGCGSGPVEWFAPINRFGPSVCGCCGDACCIIGGIPIGPCWFILEMGDGRYCVNKKQKVFVYCDDGRRCWMDWRWVNQSHCLQLWPRRWRSCIERRDDSAILTIRLTFRRVFCCCIYLCILHTHISITNLMDIFFVNGDQSSISFVKYT